MLLLTGMARDTYLESQQVLCLFQRQVACLLNPHSDCLHHKNSECLALGVFWVFLHGNLFPCVKSARNLPLNHSFCFPFAYLCLLLPGSPYWLPYMELWPANAFVSHLQTANLLLACETYSKGNPCLWPHNELFAVLGINRSGCFT